MDQNRIFAIAISIIIAVTIIIGMAMYQSMQHTQWTKELIQTSLEKGQNPMYVKCAMESNSSNECKTLVTALAVARSDK